MTNNTSNSDPLNGRKISEILTELSNGFSAPTVTIGELRDALSGRIYGIFLLLLAVPNLAPFPTPGLSAILGMPLLLLTFQLMLGMQTPWFPQIILRRTIKTEQISQVFSYILPYIKKTERVIMPRLMYLVKPPADRIIAFVCVLLSLVIMLPVPFGNALPALAICCFAIAILERDGMFAILGMICTIASIAVIFTVISMILLAILHFWGLG